MRVAFAISFSAMPDSEIHSSQGVRRASERRKAGLKKPAVDFQTALDIALQHLAIHELFTLAPSLNWLRRKRRGLRTSIGIVWAGAKPVSPPIKHILQGSSQVYLGTPAGRMLELSNVACNYRLITPAHQSLVLLDLESYFCTRANGVNEL